MINQVIFEGYLVKQWEHQDQRFLRLAGHRPQDGDGLVQSDYVTVQLDPAVTLDPHLRVGTRLVVAGRIWGRDIVETLGRVLQKADLAVDLAPALENLAIRRPTVQIAAAQVEVVGEGGRSRPAARRSRAQPHLEHTAPEQAVLPAPPLAPGVDLASLITE